MIQGIGISSRKSGPLKDICTENVALVVGEVVVNTETRLQRKVFTCRINLVKHTTNSESDLNRASQMTLDVGGLKLLKLFIVTVSNHSYFGVTKHVEKKENNRPLQEFLVRR
jgi:hypothetical protein